MRYGRAILLIIFLTATAAAQTTTGSFTVSDPRNVLGQGTSVSLNASNASFASRGGVNTSGQINGAVVAALAFEGSATWFVSIATTRSGGFTSGSYTIDGSSVTGDIGVRINNVEQRCLGGAGTLTIDNLTPNPAATGADDRISNIKGSLQLDCFNADASVSASFEYAVTADGDGGDTGGGGGGSGGGGGGGGTGGGGGGGGTGGGTTSGWFLPPRPTIGGGTGGSTPTTPTAPAAPTPQLTVHSADTFFGPLPIFSGETATTRITTGINAAFSSDVALSASSDPAGLTFAFSPTTIASPGAGTSTLTIGTSPGAPAGDYVVFVTATGGGLSATTSFRVRLECDPPTILGIDQPKSTTIQRGQTARLEVRVAGRGQFNYQWYEGHRGATHTPVQGATGPSFTTPALNSTTEYWVRVSNACGTADSTNATVNVTQ